MISDLAEYGQPVTYGQILELAAETAVSRSLPPAKARYLQMLVAARERPITLLGDEGSYETTIAVPLRLFPRVHDVAIDAALAPGNLNDALTLEVAAVSDGRLMSEWAALASLRLSR